MSGFDAMTTGDLVLCSNLLEWDAQEFDGSKEAPKHYASSRRELAQKMRNEVMRRDQVMIVGHSESGV